MLRIANRLRRLLIVSHVVHYAFAGKLYSYAPYVKEIDLWAGLFPEVVIASPCRHERPPGDCAAFTSGNILIAPQWETGGTSLGAKVRQLLATPAMVVRLGRTMLQADAIHVRCPGNLGLLGVLLAPMFCRRRVAKYAGQWTDYPDEPRTFRYQRRLLASRWWRAPVTVYGDYPQQPPHVVPFFTSIMTREQLQAAGRSAAGRQFTETLRLLFVGRLSIGKNVDLLLQALAELMARRIAFSCRIVGDGPERASLEQLARRWALQDRVRFVGGVSQEKVFEEYAAADVLVLASQTEGWPKAITEAMAYGLVCIGSDRGLMPQILGDGRGYSISPTNATELADVLAGLARSPETRRAMGLRASEWSRRYSLESLQEAIRDLLNREWNVRLQNDSLAAPVAEGAV